MKNMIKKCICGLLMAFLLVGSFNITSYAASDFPYPNVFDFEDQAMKINVGESRTFWIQSTYNYVCYIGNHSSQSTYIQCSCKKGTEYATIHIGPDETVKNVFFYFYVDEDPYKNGSQYATIEVYAQGIGQAGTASNAAYAAATPYTTDPAATVLINYANNNAAFNAYYYFMNYADLRAAFGADPDKLLQHYTTYGIKEGRIANKLK